MHFARSITRPVGKSTPKHTRLEIYPELGVRIQKAIKTPEFRNIFEKYLHVRDQSYYDFVTGQVSQLIGKQWQCTSHYPAALD